MAISSIETNHQFQIWQMKQQEFKQSELDILHLSEQIDENELEWNIIF